jgi:hypothetical protein
LSGGDRGGEAGGDEQGGGTEKLLHGLYLKKGVVLNPRVAVRACDASEKMLVDGAWMKQSSAALQI